MTGPDQPYPTRRATDEAFAAHVSAGKVAAFKALGVDMVMGQRGGASFADAFDGREWLNCHSNGGVFNLGHRNPRVVETLRAALDHLDVGNHHLISGHRAKLAERLAATTDDQLPGVVFGVSGGEAIDAAIKAARATTNRPTIVSVHGGYHGHTGLALAAGDAQYREPFGPPLPGFQQVPFDDLPAMDAAIGDNTAAVLVEPIPATLGMPIASEGYLEGVHALCRDRGALLVLDEVQTGLGRTGRFWCYQHHDVTPDVLVTGKGLSAGIYPITATLMTSAAHAVFDEQPFVHLSTAGGAELGCVVATTALDIIEEPGFLERVEELGDRFEKGFASCPFTLRRRGMMMALKFTDADGGVAAAGACYGAGIFAVFANHDRSALQFLPPLVLSDDEADEIIDRVTAALT